MEVCPQKCYISLQGYVAVYAELNDTYFCIRTLTERLLLARSEIAIELNLEWLV